MASMNMITEEMLVIEKDSGEFVGKDGVKRQWFSVTCGVPKDCRSQRYSVKEEIYDTLEKGACVIFSGNYGNSKDGQYWKVTNIERYTPPKKDK